MERTILFGISILILTASSASAQDAPIQPVSKTPANVTDAPDAKVPDVKPSPEVTDGKPSPQVSPTIPSSVNTVQPEATTNASTPKSIPGEVGNSSETKNAPPEVKAPDKTNLPTQASVALQKQEFDKGAQLYHARKFSEALKSFQKAAESGADDGNARTMMGYCYYEMRKYPDALREYNRASKEGRSISSKNKAQELARRLALSMKGICPGNCLKFSMPGWRYFDPPGKPKGLPWMVYPYRDGSGGSEFWGIAHIGEVIEYVNGRPVNKGKCPICGGTGKVTLPK